MTANNLVLSIIVPIYKVEDYLAQCIESLMKQTYRPLEILLVDDGSPDNCGMICDEYAKKDTRIQVIHKKNGGLYHAENLGFQYVTGDYIAYVDGDDYIYDESSFHLLMTEAARSSADIVVGNYHKDINGEIISTKPHGFSKNTDTQTADYRFRGFYSIGHLAYTWGKIYKHSFIAENGLAMKPYIYSLDKLFNVECYLHQPKYSFIQESVYVYRLNVESVSHQYKENFNKIWLSITNEMYQDMQNMKKGQQYIDIVAFNLFFAVFFSSKQEYIASGRRRKAVISELRKYGGNYLTQKHMKELAKGKYIRSISSIIWKIMIWSFSIAFTLKLYGLLSISIKLLIEWNIDKKLSCTGNNR
ncbi:MAG: glycosyltransferase [Anaerocolumna sp.]